MDFLANYASSDEEDREQQPQRQRLTLPAKPVEVQAGIFNSLPPPKSSLFNSLPPPNSQFPPNPNPNPNPNPRAQFERDEVVLKNSKPKSSSSLFSSFPAPKSAAKVVQFRPPTVVNACSGAVDGDDDEDDEGEKERQRKRGKESISTSSPSSFLSTMPAPRYSATLGSASGTGRRSMLETDTTGEAENVPVLNSGVGHSVYDHSSSFNGGSYAYNSGYGVSTAGSDAGMNIADGVDYSYGTDQQAEYTDYQGSFVDYGNNAQYENNWGNVTALPRVDYALKIAGKRGRKDVPSEMIEVKQDELMKNRPREDQVKSTGIAFGPAYQPATTKGKPPKLHKRKHQIGSLYFDMRQKEMELAERRSKGYLTKAQTQAKYGW